MCKSKILSVQVCNGLFHFYSIQGDGSKIPGGHSKGISGGSKILKSASLGGKNIVTNIFQGLMHLDGDFQGGCRNYPLFTRMLSIISKGDYQSKVLFVRGLLLTNDSFPRGANMTKFLLPSPLYG